MSDEAADELAIWEEGERLFLEQLLDLLAWLLAVKSGWLSPKDRVIWPLVDLWRHQETHALALSGPIFFDLMRNQLSVDFGDDPEGFSQCDQRTDLLSQFLLLDRPTNGQGSAAGRSEMKAIVGLMLHIHRPLNSWALPERHVHLNGEQTDYRHTVNAFAVALSERLNTHPRLSDLPEAILPSPEALRRLLPEA